MSHSAKNKALHVQRRIGGLETTAIYFACGRLVQRRIGGLEIEHRR